MIAAAGLAVATSPDYAHYLTLFQSTANHNNFLTGLTTVLAPAVGASIFIMLAILALHRKRVNLDDWKKGLRFFSQYQLDLLARSPYPLGSWLLSKRYFI